MARKLRFALCCLLALATSSTSSYAEVEPIKGRADNRIREIMYDARDIIRVKTFFGVRSLIRFPIDEKIVDYSGADNTAWDISKALGKNYMSIQPLLENPNMNMFVVTEDKQGIQRDYNFILSLINAAQRSKTPFDSEEITLNLRIIGNEDIRSQKKREEIARIEAEKQEIKKELNPGNPLQTQRDFNFDYWSCGDQLITPTSAYDDGQMIRLTFANNRDIPAVHEVFPDGSESLISHSMVNLTTMVIPKVVKKLVLRKDPLVACVVNMSYDPDNLQDNVTGTSSGKVYRELKGQTQ
ncbi:MAG: TrbG/VirB9 family P-type conjugative transfer protein [Candidatus Saccharibacteria bacterium]|nr:TrbG/VirB9 family P-type conjugative transfer protein [Candidatus Saccharibacteria bacterium]